MSFGSNLNSNQKKEVPNEPIPPQADIWELVSQPNLSDYQWSGVAYGNGIFVACAAFGTSAPIGQVMTSPDGLNWTARDLPVITALTPRDICYGNGMFVIACSAGFVARLLYSPDGINWTAANVSELQSRECVCYSADLGIFVSLGRNGTSGLRAWTSVDGINWTGRATPVAADLVWEEITYGNGLFVAVASNGNDRVLTSPDGINWTLRDAGAGDAISWRGIDYGAGLFVAVGSPDAQNNAVMTSPDGITWTLRTVQVVAGGGGSWFSMVYGYGTFVVVGNGSLNNVMKSTDGIIWEEVQVNPSTNQALIAVTFGNGMWVAVGNAGSQRILVSGRPLFNTMEYQNSLLNNMWRFLRFLVPYSTKRVNVGGRLKEFFTDAGNGVAGVETDLYSYNTEANILSENGQTISMKVGGTYVDTAAIELKLYFGGQMFFNSTAFTAATPGAFQIIATLVRVSSTVVRCVTSLMLNDSAAEITNYTELTAMDLTIANILKITGESDTVANDVVAKLATVDWSPASV